MRRLRVPVRAQWQWGCSLASAVASSAGAPCRVVLGATSGSRHRSTELLCSGSRRGFLHEVKVRNPGVGLQGRDQAFRVTLVVPNGHAELAGRGGSAQSWGCSGDAVTAMAWVLGSRIRTELFVQPQERRVPCASLCLGNTPWPQVEQEVVSDPEPAAVWEWFLCFPRPLAAGLGGFDLPHRTMNNFGTFPDLLALLVRARSDVE